MRVASGVIADGGFLELRQIAGGQVQVVEQEHDESFRTFSGMIRSRRERTRLASTGIAGPRFSDRPETLNFYAPLNAKSGDGLRLLLIKNLKVFLV